MDIREEFLTVQKNWIARTILDRKAQLKEAEDAEDYEQCYEIKESLDRGMKIVNGTLKVDQEILDHPYSYPRLMFELFSSFNKITGELHETRTQQAGVEVYTFRFGHHIYNAIKMDRFDPKTGEEHGMQPKFDIENPKYPDCGAIEGNYIYIIEKACNCNRKPSFLYEMADDVMLSCINSLEQYQQGSLNINPIQ